MSGRPIRVAVDARSTVGKKAGIGVATANLLEAMQLATDPEVELLPFHGSGDWSMRTPQRLYWDQWQVPSEARRLGADVLHCPGFSAPFVSPCPVVLTVHDLI